jgi:hypothetical protein
MRTTTARPPPAITTTIPRLPRPGAPAADGAAQATAPDLGGNPDLGACCHVVASLPVQPAALPAVPPALDTPRLQGLPALSHTTGGPFRPPRPLPA